MPAATMTSKGQVTMPKEVRDDLHLEAGTKVWFVRTDQGWLVKPMIRSVMDLKGMANYDGPPRTIEEMDQGIADAINEDWQRQARDL